jgi:hypothetical protein
MRTHARTLKDNGNINSYFAFIKALKIKTLPSRVTYPYLSIHIRPTLHQQSSNLRVTLFWCPVQGGPLVLGTDGCAKWKGGNAFKKAYILKIWTFERHYVTMTQVILSTRTRMRKHDRISGYILLVIQIMWKNFRVMLRNVRQGDSNVC